MTYGWVESWIEATTNARLAQSLLRQMFNMVISSGSADTRFRFRQQVTAGSQSLHAHHRPGVIHTDYLNTMQSGVRMARRHATKNETLYSYP